MQSVCVPVWELAVFKDHRLFEVFSYSSLSEWYRELVIGGVEWGTARRGSVGLARGKTLLGLDGPLHLFAVYLVSDVGIMSYEF